MASIAYIIDIILLTILTYAERENNSFFQEVKWVNSGAYPTETLLEIKLVNSICSSFCRSFRRQLANISSYGWKSLIRKEEYKNTKKDWQVE